MSAIFSQFGNLPGMGTPSTTYEAAMTWGPMSQLLWWNGYIASATIDSGNSPTNILRPGLLLGQITSTGQWTNYSPTATDGSQVAGAILPFGLSMLDYLTNTNQQKFIGIVVGGRGKGANILGLDNMARAQLTPKFIFDDNLFGNQWFDWPNFVSKTAAYQVLSTDNFTLFDNVGATGAVTFTLPAIANGYKFGFRVQADQTVTVASTEGTNIVTFNNASASSVAYSTGGSKIGGMFTVFSNPGATKWIVIPSGSNTVTVA